MATGRTTPPARPAPADPAMMPGGLVADGRRLRDYRFRTITGDIELRLSELSSRLAKRPDAVTAVLAEAVEHIGGRGPEIDDVRRLAVGDRQFLMRRLAIHLGTDALWLTVECAGCGKPFDAEVLQSQMPVKEAPDGFPFARVEIRKKTWELRVPSGLDQEDVALGVSGDDPAAAVAVIEKCMARGGGPAVARLSAKEISRIETALEDASPEVGTSVVSDCPTCGEANEVYLDPSAGIDPKAGELLADIHLLASTYRWSESEILRMSRDRRRSYARMIERMRGTPA